MPSVSRTRRRALPSRLHYPSSSRRQHFAALRHAGCTDEQLARVAGTTVERVSSLRAGKAAPDNDRELTLITPVDHVRELIQQQEALAFLLQHGLTRSDIAEALRLSLEGLKYWEGRKYKIKRATGKRRALLLTFVTRLKRLLKTNRKLDLRSEPPERATKIVKSILGTVRLPKQAVGRVTPEKRKRFISTMRDTDLWPPPVRARAVAELLATAEQATGATKTDYARKFQTSRTFISQLLDPKDKVVIPPDMAHQIEQALVDIRKQAKRQPSLEDRFIKAMTTLLGRKVITSGFKPNDPRAPKVRATISRAMGWSDRNTRRYLPPYPKGWWRDRAISLPNVEKLEALAARKGKLI